MIKYKAGVENAHYMQFSQGRVMKTMEKQMVTLTRGEETKGEQLEDQSSESGQG